MTNRPEWRSAGAPARFGAAIAHDLGDLAGEALCLSILAIESRTEGRRDEMVRIATDNLVMARESGDPDAIARALLNASRAWEAIDEKAPGFVAYNRELIALRDRIIDQTLVVRALADAARDLAHDSFYSREWLLLMDDSLLLARAIGDTLGEASAEASLAVGLANGTDCLAAMPHFERAEALERRVRGSYLNRILAVKSECLFELGLTAHAEREMLEAEATADGDFGTLGSVATSKARLAAMRGDVSEAECYVAEADRFLDETGNPGDDDGTVWLVEMQMRHHQFRSAAELASQRADITIRGSSYLLLRTLEARALRRLGKRREAEAALTDAIDAGDSRFANSFGAGVRRAGTFTENVAAADELVDLLIEEGRLARALQVADDAKGHVLRALLGQPADSDATGPDDGDRLHAAERSIVTLESQLDALRVRAAVPRRELLDLMERIRLARSDYGSIQDVIEARSVRDDADRIGQTISIAAAAASLRPGECLVEYVLQQSGLNIFVLTRGQSGAAHLIVRRVHVPIATIEKRTRELQSRLTERSLRYPAAARALYDLLLAPIENDIGTRSLCIVADPALYDVPFAALLDRRGHFVIESRAVSYAPSVGVRLFMRAQATHSHQPSILAIANATTALPRLTDAEDEVRAIRTLFGSRCRLLVGSDATEARVKELAGDFDILHFATHGILDDDDPMYSKLMLAGGGGEDGKLEAREIVRLRLHGALVVLAACDTARGRLRPGAGTVGTAWSFLVSGARTILSSHWQVDSKATALLMKRFYQALAAGSSTPEALRQAQNEIARTERYHHPYYWAAFGLIGSASD
jgi:CHAT domain-containing protein